MTEYIEKEIQKLHENRKQEKDKMNNPIMEKEVRQAIKSLMRNKRAGPDKIKNKFIKYGGGRISKIIIPNI